jgi:hypothetical protein
LKKKSVLGNKSLTFGKNSPVFGNKSVSGIKSLDFGINSLAFGKIPCLLEKKIPGVVEPKYHKPKYHQNEIQRLTNR